MTKATQVVWIGLFLMSGCGGKQAAGAHKGEMSKMDKMMSESMDMSADEGSTFGPLEVGADWATYVKVNTSPVTSETHGGRLVDTYVNQVGAAAYIDDAAEIPVGTVVVKTSKEADGSDGPVFVMKKQAAGSDPARGDWYYALHWANPSPAWQKKLGGPVYWRTPSKRATYCVECHENYDRGLGSVPAPQRIQSLPQ